MTADVTRGADSIVPTQRKRPTRYNRGTALAAYQQIARARALDKKCLTLYKQNKSFFFISAAGHEAVQVAAGLVFRPGVDWFYPYYRGLGIAVALGMEDRALALSFMNKKNDPMTAGRQMPMHYSSPELHIVSQSSPTGTQFLQAVGTALGSVRAHKKEVTLVTSGEGACAQGDFHEALNWASREKLPTVFLIENNGFAISVPLKDQIAGESIYKVSAGYENLAREEIDGTDLKASINTLRAAHERALAGEGPTVIEAHVPRLGSHSISDDQSKYREQDAIAEDFERCPFTRLHNEIVSSGWASEEELNEIVSVVDQQVKEASNWAEQQPDGDPTEALTFTYQDPTPWHNVAEAERFTGQELAMVDAINQALDEELARDERTFVFGQDVADGKGGVFTVTAGLTKKHGRDRVFNSQLAESSIVGAAIGMAVRGLSPVPEIQFGDYVWTGMMQIRNELAMMSYRSGGAFSAPVVLRIPIGGYIRGSHYHSQNIEATFAHFPGLYVVLPSNAADAKGLLKAAIRGKDPVLFLEHKGLYRQPSAKCSVGGKDDLVPLGKGKIKRHGNDLTLITYGALVAKSLWVAEQLGKEGYSVEVIDLRSIVPLDTELIIKSVEKTSRVVIAHEDVTFMGFGAELSATIASECFTSLDAPIARVGMKSAAAVPHAPPLEYEILPQSEDILESVRQTLLF